MNGRARFVPILSLMAGLAAPASAEGWRLAEQPGLELTFSEGASALYRFECGPSDVAVTHVGATELLDLATGTHVGDEPGSNMAPGAAVMALFTGRGDPSLQPAAAAPNPAKGWNLTIRLAKTDPAFLGLARAKMVSLFTTGFTRAVELGKADRKRLAEFVERCRQSS